MRTNGNLSCRQRILSVLVLLSGFCLTIGLSARYNYVHTHVTRNEFLPWSTLNTGNPAVSILYYDAESRLVQTVEHGYFSERLYYDKAMRNSGDFNQISRNGQITGIRIRQGDESYAHLCGKFFVCLCRYKSHCFKTQMQNMGKAVHKCVTMLLVHNETGSMVLLKRVVFQIYKNKEKPLRDIRQRAILVYAEAATVTSPLTIEFVLKQIIIMRGLEIGKQMRKLNMSQARQGTETFGIIFMVGIIHATKVHAYAIYNKSNLH